MKARGSRHEKEELNTDSKGQMQMPDIDTPLGAKCDEYLKVNDEVNAAKTNLQNVQEELIQEMKKVNKRTLKFNGYVLRYTPGHQTPDKIQIRTSEQ